MDYGSEILARWPREAPVGVLVLGPNDDTFANTLSKDPSVTAWWSATAQNMFVGPSVDSPFEQMHLFEATDPATAARLVNDSWSDASQAQCTILVGRPAPAAARLLMRAMHLALHWLPDPKAPDGESTNAPSEFGGVNPTQEQLEAFKQHPCDEPVLILNLNHHRKHGIHPDTGEPGSGHELANLYLKRGIKTFNRLGARALWVGGCRGAIRDDLDVGGFDQIGLILYPSRRSFDRLLAIGRAEGWDRYRQAGFDHSWNVHCRMTASSERGDVG